LGVNVNVLVAWGDVSGRRSRAAPGQAQVVPAGYKIEPPQDTANLTSKAGWHCYDNLFKKTPVRKTRRE